MNNISLEDQVQKMKFIVYQIPMGLIEADFDGNLLQMNAKSMELLMPQFFQHQLSGDNINELLEKIAPSVLKQVKQYTKPAGCIVNQQKQEITVIDENDSSIIRHYVFTVNKLDSNSVMYIFDDVSNIYEKEKQLNKVMQDKAIEQSKFEMASGVLHDIGNAVVGFSSYNSRIKRSIEQNDIGTIENLRTFMEKNHSGIQGAIGEKKADAVLNLLKGVIENQKDKLSDLNNSIRDQAKIIAHIEEILNIQRQYVVGKSVERAPVNIKSVIDDALAILLETLSQYQINFKYDGPDKIPDLKGDRTKLIQVFTNLIKNSIDSVIAVDYFLFSGSFLFLE